MTEPRAFIFDLDGTLVDSNELHVDAWDRAFRRFDKIFYRAQLRAQIGKGSDKYLPEFLSPDEMKRFGKKLDGYRSRLFAEQYLPRVIPSPGCASSSSVSTMTAGRSFSRPPARKKTLNSASND